MNPLAAGEKTEGIHQVSVVDIEHGHVHARSGLAQFAKNQGQNIATRREGNLDLTDVEQIDLGSAGEGDGPAGHGEQEAPVVYTELTTR